MGKVLGAHGLEAGKVIWCRLPYVPPASLFVVCDSLGMQTGVILRSNATLSRIRSTGRLLVDSQGGARDRGLVP